MHRLITVRISLFAILLGGLLFAACRKEQSAALPPTAVDISFNVNNPAYVDLAVPGGWIYITGGSMGIIVYRKTIDEFVALDRLCRYQTTENCRVIVDDSQVTATDTACCGSSYLILDGSVTQGPTSLGLIRYNTTFNGTTLRIFN